MKNVSRGEDMQPVSSIRAILILGVISILLFGCKGSPNSGSVTQGIPIKGTLSTGVLHKYARSGSVDSLTLADARKVLVFNAGTYKLFDIADSSFTAYAQTGTATALAFVDANDKYIGNLCADGLNVLPLVSLKDGDNTVIDLSTLTLDGTSVLPANNPIGTTIELTPAEVERFKELGAYYESLSKNIDADNDGVPDILVDKRIGLNTVYRVYMGRFGINDTVPQSIDTSQFFVNYQLRFECQKNLIPSSKVITLSGPAGHPYNDIKQFEYHDAPDGFITFFQRPEPAASGMPFDSLYLPFEQGTYTLTLDGNRNYTLQYSNVNSKYYMLVAAPTMHTDDQDRITSITMEYRLLDNTTADPTNFVSQVAVFLGGQNGNSLGQIGSLYSTPGTTGYSSEKVNFTVNPPIPLSQLQSVMVDYTDLIGNEYQVLWGADRSSFK